MIQVVLTEPTGVVAEDEVRRRHAIDLSWVNSSLISLKRNFVALGIKKGLPSPDRDRAASGFVRLGDVSLHVSCELPRCLRRDLGRFSRTILFVALMR